MLENLRKNEPLEKIAAAINKESKKSWLITVSEGSKARFRKIFMTFSNKTGTTKYTITGRYAGSDGKLLEVLRLDVTKQTKTKKVTENICNFVGEGECPDLKEIASLIK